MPGQSHLNPAGPVPGQSLGPASAAEGRRGADSARLACREGQICPLGGTVRALSGTELARSGRQDARICTLCSPEIKMRLPWE